MPSEIAQILQKIEMEQQAMRQGLTGLASVARHDFIQAKQARIDEHHARLIEVIGEKATELVDGVLESIYFLYDCQNAQPVDNGMLPEVGGRCVTGDAPERSPTITQRGTDRRYTTL